METIITATIVIGIVITFLALFGFILLELGVKVIHSEKMLLLGGTVLVVGSVCGKFWLPVFLGMILSFLGLVYTFVYPEIFQEKIDSL